MKLSLQLKLGQQLTMTPQLQQAIKLLQLSTLDLQQEIQEALETNPMLEIDEEFEALRAKEMAQVDGFEGQDLQAEAAALSLALDQAFEQLTGEKLEDGEMDFQVDGEINNLDLSVDLAIMKGKDFDLDLSFLNEVSEELINKSDE